MSETNGIGHDRVEQIREWHQTRQADLAKLRGIVEKLGPQAPTAGIKEAARTAGLAHIADDQRICAARKAVGFPPRARGGKGVPRAARAIGPTAGEALASKRLDEGEIQTICGPVPDDPPHGPLGLGLPDAENPVALLAEMAVLVGLFGGLEAARRALETIETIRAHAPG